MDKLTEVARRNNNFDALRIAAAAAVILGHASELRGHPDEMPVVFGIPLTQLAVGVFFVISGYLISGSWERRPQLPRYLTNRVLRIIPGLLLRHGRERLRAGADRECAGPAATISADGGPILPRNAVLIPNYALPGVFGDNPFPVAVNGSLWTLPAEFACYLVVPVHRLAAEEASGSGLGRFGLASVVLATVLHFELLRGARGVGRG